MAEDQSQDRSEESKKLIAFAKKHNILLNYIDEAQFVSSGAEQLVYIINQQEVIKLNDAIYYASWEHYLQNLLLHNYFFADTAYQLIGFYLKDNTLYAVVKQPFVITDNFTDLSKVKDFLISNGFELVRNNDYYHPKLGILLEDLHDENVLTNNNTLYFIDTVFYIKPEVFWK